MKPEMEVTSAEFVVGEIMEAGKAYHENYDRKIGLGKRPDKITVAEHHRLFVRQMMVRWQIQPEDLCDEADS